MSIGLFIFEGGVQHLVSAPEPASPGSHLNDFTGRRPDLPPVTKDAFSALLYSTFTFASLSCAFIKQLTEIGDGGHSPVAEHLLLWPI